MLTSADVMFEYFELFSIITEVISHIRPFVDINDLQNNTLRFSFGQKRLVTIF